MTGTLNVSIALDTYDRTFPLINGEIEPNGLELTPFTPLSPERHRRMLNHTEFDICELSCASYLASVEKDYPFTAIPVFPHRKFRQGHMFKNVDAGITDPKDIEGKRVGLRRWQNTAGLWMRGIAREYYDVDLTTVEWHIDDMDEIPIDVPAEYTTHRIPDEQNINDMLVNGELDAAMYPRPPTAYTNGNPNVDRIFPDYKTEELKYYRDTGLFPIMHVIVIRDELVEEHPWVPMEVQKAFERARTVAMNELDHVRKISLVWAQELLEEQRELLGDDLWLNGVEANRLELEAMIRFARADGLLTMKTEPEDLFIDSSLEELPSYV